MVTLVVIAPWREQLRLGAVGLLAAVLGAVAAAPFRSVTSLAGNAALRERQGATVLGLLVALMALSGVAAWWFTRGEASRPLRLPRFAARLALVLICLGLAGAIVAGAKEHSTRSLGAGAQRFGTLQSNRYAYWDVALRAFRDEPLRGVGAGGWSVYWLHYRHIDELAQDAHSLPLQTLAELGLVGFALLLVFLGSVAVVALRAHRTVPAAAAGPIAAIVTYIAHSPLDWDWEMPTVTLFAVILTGVVLALGDQPARERPLLELDPVGP
jgi:O-antigen ligase